MAKFTSDYIENATTPKDKAMNEALTHDQKTRKSTHIIEVEGYQCWAFVSYGHEAMCIPFDSNKVYPMQSYKQVLVFGR